MFTAVFSQQDQWRNDNLYYRALEFATKNTGIIKVD